MQSTKFALIGCSGYIAPRHMAAITRNGGELVAACDISDSAGVLDQYAPHCRFTQNPSEFFRSQLYDVDYVVVCTPNHLHPTHAIMALEQGCDVILEKPVATEWRWARRLLRQLSDNDLAVTPHCYPVVQLRYHPRIMALQAQLQSEIHDVEIDYRVWRGEWYDRGWKARTSHSGGLLVNIGVHLFDLCLQLFGECEIVREATIGPYEAHGRLRCSRAEIKWRLSTRATESRTFRVDSQTIDLTTDIEQLHDRVYAEIFAGQGQELFGAAHVLRLIDWIKENAK